MCLSSHIIYIEIIKYKFSRVLSEHTQKSASKHSRAHHQRDSASKICNCWRTFKAVWPSINAGLQCDFKMRPDDSLDDLILHFDFATSCTSCYGLKKLKKTRLRHRVLHCLTRNDSSNVIPLQLSQSFMIIQYYNNYGKISSKCQRDVSRIVYHTHTHSVIYLIYL